MYNILSCILCWINILFFQEIEICFNTSKFLTNYLRDQSIEWFRLKPRTLYSKQLDLKERFADTNFQHNYATNEGFLHVQFAISIVFQEFFLSPVTRRH